MPFDLLAYSQSQDSAILANITPVADQHASVNGNNIVVDADYSFLAMTYALGPSLTQAQIQTPSMMGRIPYDIDPIDVNALPQNATFLHDFTQTPLKMKAGEDMSALMAENGVGATRGTVLAWVSNGPLVPDEKGDIITVRATSTTTLTANAWTNGTLTLQNSLEAGTYELVGAHAFSTNLQAFRFVFRNQGNRPGGIGYANAGNIPNRLFRRGRLGVWGKFTNQTLPTVDFLANGADTSETIYLDVRKITS